MGHRPFDITRQPALTVIIRAQHMTGQQGEEARAELKRRGLWLPQTQAQGVAQ